MAWIEKIQKNYEEALSKIVLEKRVFDSICEGHCVQWISARQSNEVIYIPIRSLMVGFKNR